MASWKDVVAVVTLFLGVILVGVGIMVAVNAESSIVKIISILGSFAGLWMWNSRNKLFDWAYGPSQ